MTSESHGAIWWSELCTRDPAAARAFCARLYGWEIEEMPDPNGGIYLVCRQGGQAIAGIFDMAKAPHIPESVPAHWMTYIAVDDVDATVAEATGGGGRVGQPPFDIPGVGRIAMVADPTGAIVGVMTPEPSS